MLRRYYGGQLSAPTAVVSIPYLFSAVAVVFVRTRSAVNDPHSYHVHIVDVPVRQQDS